VAIESVRRERNVMHGRGHVPVLLAVCLALLATVASSVHAHSIDHAGNSSACTGCVLGLSPVEVIGATDCAEPDFESSPVATPTCVALCGQTTNSRLSRGPPLRPARTRQP
jgi:hypothetical protein